jgi:hypothetical protein
MPSGDRRTKSSSPSTNVHSRPVEDARPASTDQPRSLRRPSRGSHRSCGTTSTQRPRQILVPAVRICGGPAGAIPAGYPATARRLRPGTATSAATSLPSTSASPWATETVEQPHRW